MAKWSENFWLSLRFAFFFPFCFSSVLPFSPLMPFLTFFAFSPCFAFSGWFSLWPKSVCIFPNFTLSHSLFPPFCLFHLSFFMSHSFSICFEFLSVFGFLLILPVSLISFLPFSLFCFFWPCLCFAFLPVCFSVLPFLHCCFFPCL